MSIDARDRILDACERVIAVSGLAKFRMSAVATEAGVSIGLLSYHFGDRDGLLQAALDRVNAGATSRAATMPELQTARARLEALLCSDFGDDEQVRAGSIVWNEVRAAAVFDADRAVVLSRSTSSWQDAVRELVAETAVETAMSAGAGAGAALQLDFDLAALSLTALVEGLSGRWLTGQITASQAQSTVRAAVRSLV
ncbi:AcrR family transcriptional regulator [Leucobacter exalbidus]|uniref:AcrR family transcriptional regulator n=1 Tax=Leucobacter exalbidus TaxID=662960 RepID=A0A940PRU6_9MICO|nr:TetR family transcriptional regulator [Leucobacter exalbidus]MBP1325618.1 AcrR family transcriptional regulator [Leucobacter exalbidus]